MSHKKTVQKFKKKIDTTMYVYSEVEKIPQNTRGGGSIPLAVQ